MFGVSYLKTAVFFILWLQGYVTFKLETRPGAVQYRIAQSQFLTTDKNDQHGFTYETQPQEVIGSFGKFKDTVLRVRVSEVVQSDKGRTTSSDGNTIKYWQEYSKVRLEVEISLIGVDGFGLKHFSVAFSNVSLESFGDIVSGNQTLTPGRHNDITITTARCDATFDNMVKNVSKLGDDLILALQTSQTELVETFKRVLCNTFPLELTLGFKTSKLRMNACIFNMSLQLQTLKTEIKESTVLATQAVHVFTKGKRFPTDLFSDHDITFPPIRQNPKPYEIWINAGIFDTVWDAFKKDLGLGYKYISVKDIMPTFPYAEVPVEKLFVLPTIMETFPNSTIEFMIWDADANLNITDTAMQFQFNLTGELLATLNCDRSKKYSVLKFRMVFYMPTQIGHDNKHLKTKFLGFGGNFTVLESNIGHIADRWLQTMFYVIPQYAIEKFDILSKNLKGTRISQMVPSGLYLKDVAVSMTEGHIIVGGELTSTNPNLPVINTSWIGEHEPVVDLALPLFDTTPDDLSPMSEQNCKPPPPPPPASTNEATRLILTTHNIVLSLLVSITILLPLT